jgi:hypothetical protein
MRINDVHHDVIDGAVSCRSVISEFWIGSTGGIDG